MLKRILALAVLAVFATLPAQELTLVLSLDKEDGVYQQGETVVYRLRVLKDGKMVPGQKISCVMRNDGRPDHKAVLITGMEVIREESPLDKPGWTMMTAELLGEDGQPLPKSRKRIGAMIAPEKLLPGGEEPADFDAFWKSQREKLDKVPLKFTVTEVPVPRDKEGKFLGYDVKVDCAGGMPVSGYLSIPIGAEKKSLKAIVRYHGAGVRSANMGFRENALYFDVNAHGIDNGKPGTFYQELDKGTLRGYPHKNKNDREAIYFSGMFLRVMRAMDFITSLPEWDGKNLLVHGFSQGGGQALAAAALDSRVTFCFAAMPALCDHGGLLAARPSGWPHYLKLSGGQVTEPKVAEAVAYYDCAFFARRIKAETYMSAGFCDTTCPPTSVLAAYNSIPTDTKKRISYYPATGHSGKDIPAENRIGEIVK